MIVIMIMACVTAADQVPSYLVIYHIVFKFVLFSLICGHVLESIFS